jgi:hypothetical protein
LLGVLGLSLLLPGAGCQRAERAVDESGWRDLTESLDRLGYWDDLSQEEKLSGIEEIVRSGNIFMLDSPRFVSADDESLAEFGIGEFLNELRDTLRRYGASFVAIEDRETEGYGYSVSVDGRVYEVYTAAHLEAEERGEWNIWKRGAKTTQRILNDLLEQGGSETRAYWYGGGNEAFVWFLTPDMARVITESGLFGPDEMPTVID